MTGRAGERKRHWLAIGALLVSGCTMTGNETPEASQPEANDVAALAATFRYLFANNASGLRTRAASYCIGIGARADAADPSPELLAALLDVSPEVRPASTCRVEARVLDPAGQPSLLFTLAPAGCEGADECLFEGGYYEANLSASSGRYRARRVGDRWQVSPEGPQAIS